VPDYQPIAAEFGLGRLLAVTPLAGGRAGVVRLTTAAFLPQMRQLPVQVVHGDIGPDNVLMDGDEVVAVIDFTPFAEPVLFAIATALYWYHVHGQAALDCRAVRASFAAAGQQRVWSGTEAASWPVMLLREALRRLATPLALAGEPGSPVPAAFTTRYQAVRSILRSWPYLEPAKYLSAAAGNVTI
jgi:Ser/Thr protein kinase RdoA (MazF antagonist)